MSLLSRLRTQEGHRLGPWDRGVPQRRLTHKQGEGRDEGLQDGGCDKEDVE